MSEDTWDISAGSKRDLEERLSDYYGVDEIWHDGDYYHEGRGEYLYDVLTYWDGEDEHFIASDVPVYGHGPSGAVGVYTDDLPDKDAVVSVVEQANGDRESPEDGGDDV